ncbi:uncharacterized protein LOC142767808 [Rhipicephalus microplus]|uniref:uncharacterized protein LOC142767808 n=1 Tax=Rhipicephalus microplus TaxID=6941 RepID=UPI003F6CE684
MSRGKEIPLHDNLNDIFENAFLNNIADSENSHTPADVQVAAKLASAERLAIQKPNIGALRADEHYAHQRVTTTDDASSQKLGGQQKLPALTATVAGTTWPEGTLVAAMPVNKSKRVSIDPHPTIEDLTPESSSPTPSVERGAMKAPPMMRQSADRGAASGTSNQLGEAEISKSNPS